MIEKISQLKGVNIKHSFYLKNGEASGSICNIPKGFRCAIIIASDRLINYREKALMWCYKYGYKMTFNDDTNSSYSNDYYKTGIFDFGVYFPSTNGTLQAQLNNNIFTLADVIIGNIATVRDGKTPTVMSYGGGLDSYRDNLYTRFLAGRNSRHTNDTKQVPVEGSRTATDNDAMEYQFLNKEKLMSRPVCNRYDYYKKTSTIANTDAEYNSGFEWQGDLDYERKINKVYQTNNIYTVFSHLHWVFRDGFMTLLIKFNSLIYGKNFYKGQWVEIMEYWYVKDSVDTFEFNPDNLSVNITYSKKDVTRPYANITTPLWIEVNLKGTSLEGSFIQTSAETEIIEKSTDVYVIGFPLDFSITSKSFTISSSSDKNHYSNQNIPEVTVNTTTKLISSDQPIKYTLFSKLKSQQEADVSIVEEFMHTLNSSPTIEVTLNTATKDYYLGFVNSFGVSGLINF